MKNNEKMLDYYQKIMMNKIEQIKKKDFELAETMESISKLTRDLNSSEQGLQSSQHELQKAIQKIEFLGTEVEKQRDNLTIALNDLTEFRRLFLDDENRSFWNSSYQFPTSIINKVRELKHANKWKEFLEVASFIEGGGSMMSQTSLNAIKEFGIVIQGDKLLNSVSTVSQPLIAHNERT